MFFSSEFYQIVGWISDLLIYFHWLVDYEVVTCVLTYGFIGLVSRASESNTSD